jgi:hypothetical protein
MPEHWLISRYFRLQHLCPIATRLASVSWEQPCRGDITQYLALVIDKIHTVIYQLSTEMSEEKVACVLCMINICHH